MEQENMEPDIVEPEIVEGEIEEEEKDPTLQFIESVKEHQCIWDMQSEEYYNRKMYREAWKSLIPPSVDTIPEQPLDESQQKADIEEKVAELQKVWVELRDSYYKNEDPGKRYRESLRFLHTVYQSREMEAILEFDEPSWDIMDLRTWTVLKTRIPRCKRSTDPAPEYEKAKYKKKPKICTNEANTPNKNNVTCNETVSGKENATSKENGTDTENATGKENATNRKNTTDKNNVPGPDKITYKENATGKEKATDNDNVTAPENVTDKDNVTGKEKATDKDNVTDPKCVTDKEDATVNENAGDKEDTTGNKNATDKAYATGNENVTDKENVTVKDNVTGSQNVTDKVNATDKDNVTGSQNVTDKENVKDIENATVKEANVTGKKKATKNKKEGRDEHQLTILEKAMRLYELDNPGIWSSDEDDEDKASRIYVDNTTQTDETAAYPNMPIFNA